MSLWTGPRWLRFRLSGRGTRVSAGPRLSGSTVARAALVAWGLMTTAEDDPDREHDSQATEAPAPAAETPTGLHQAAAGIADAQAWKGQQIARGWRKLVNALRRHHESEG
jgi:hypothetical protein